MGNLLTHKPDNGELRHIYPSVNNSSIREKYITNGVCTQKYNVLTFIPKNLFEQFHRFANIYFVFILILNYVPMIEAFGRNVAPIPVIFVLAVTAIKDAVEDWRRGQTDRRVNQAHCSIYNPASCDYESQQWQHVVCGDIVKMRVNETVPADMVLLYSGDESGMCHLETANIDGESNLKMREVVPLSDNQTFRVDMLTNVVLEVEPPNKEIYKFAGTLYRHGQALGIPLRKNNLLLRGCTLRNTVDAIGIVVYTGKETKAMMNNNKTRFKRSKLERQINKDVIWCVLLLIILSLSCAIGNLIWSLTTNSQNLNFYSFPDAVPINLRSGPMQAFLTFWTMVIYFQAMIPLPLYVTFELVKMHQVFHIRQDIEMYDDQAQKGLEVRAFNIPEDLGQIQYVFCDKTGTLTENKMEFKRACVRGVDYVDVDEPNVNDATNVLGAPGNPISSVQQGVKEDYEASMYDLLKITHIDKYDLGKGDESLSEKVRDFFLLMAICNTTVVSLNKNEKNPVIKTKKTDLRSKIRKGLQLAGEGMISLSAKNLFVKSGRASLNDNKEIDSQDAEAAYKETNKSLELLTYKRRGSALQGFDDVKIFVNNEPISDIIKPNTRKTKSVLDFRNEVYEVYNNGSNKNVTIQVEEPTEFDRCSAYNRSQCDSVDLSDPNCMTNTGDTVPKCPLSDAILFASYESESPDEMALVKTACKYGYKLLQRGPGFVTIWNPEHERAITHKVLQVLPFDSNRKRMSIIIEYADSKEIILYCKGADSAMFSRLASSASQNELDETKDYLEIYARKGLRTLVMGKRVINKDYFEDWDKRYREIEQKLSDNEAELSTVTSEMETEMTLLGVSGIEDCLQDGVPDTIECLRKAGITVWILTGDKRETAINIAYSANLFTDNQKLINLFADTKEKAHDLIKDYLLEIEGKYPTEIMVIRQGRERPLIRQDLALCVDGETLTLVMCPELKMDFLRLAEQCSSVVCARTTPMQKAEMVQLVKENLRMQTLAIGDGANDVSMIQTADVGVGIGGNEGMQAVMASDFAMTKFKHLKRLLLVHGSWCYNKLARTALWMFYKDTVYILLMFWFQFFNAFSATVQMDQLTQILFNITMTGLPPIIFGIWDKDHQAETLMSNPQLYSHGINCKTYKPWHFWANIADSIWQSLVIFFICYGTLTSSDIGIWEFGQVITACALVTCLVHLGIETRFWTWFHILGIFISVVLAFFVFNMIYNSICGPVICSSDNPNFFIFSNMQRLPFWLLCIITPAAAILPRLVLNVIINSIYPNMLIKAQVREKTLGRGRDLNLNHEPELVSVKRSGTFMNSVFRRPTIADLREISAEYGLAEQGATIRPHNMNTLASANTHTTRPVRQVKRYDEIIPIKEGDGFINPVLERQGHEVQHFLNEGLCESRTDQRHPKLSAELIYKC